MPHMTMSRLHRDSKSIDCRIRKVRSLDFSSTTTSTRTQQDLLASKFSQATQFGRYSIKKRSSAKLPSLLLDPSASNISDELSISSNESDQHPSVVRLLQKRGTVGVVSLVMLVFFTLSNMAVSHYAGERHQGSLGTAAISVVTDRLSPILPFAGGLDLRRDWDPSREGWFHAARSMLDQAYEAFGYNDEDSTSKVASSSSGVQKEVSKKSAHRKRTKVEHVTALSTSTPFVSIEAIAGMTLGDFNSAFQFAIESNRGAFSERRAIDAVDAHLKSILMAMKKAVQKSRGEGVEPALTSVVSSSSPLQSGDIDALQFCAIMRLFSEWRVVRQVPDGYKGYAVGMTLGQKDVIQNVGKIEKMAHEWIEHRRDLISLQSQWSDNEETCPLNAQDAEDCTLRSPTLRELLQHEIDMDVHDNKRLPRLKDKTAAMGLLWVRRQLAYQTALFANILQVSKSFKTTHDAISSAYREVYGDYHGWAVQKIFNYSFQAAPEVDVIYRYMNPQRLATVSQKARQIKIVKFAASGNERTIPPSGAIEDNPFIKFSNHVGNEWDKLVSSIVGLFEGRQNDDAHDETIGFDPREEFITKEMTRDAHEHIIRYLTVVKPVLGDLGRLFDDMNMDDPTKV